MNGNSLTLENVREMRNAVNAAANDSRVVDNFTFVYQAIYDTLGVFSVLEDVRESDKLGNRALLAKMKR